MVNVLSQHRTTMGAIDSGVVDMAGVGCIVQKQHLVLAMLSA